MVPETGQLDWDDLDRCLTDHRDRLLAIGAASNALGTINDVARAVAMAHEAEALTFVDAVHSAPHQLVDVQALGCDFLACSAYKFYGPHVGVLYGKRERLEALDVPKLAPAPDTAPERLETGTQNHEGIVGAAAAVDYLASLAGHPDGIAPTRRARLRLSSTPCMSGASPAGEALGGPRPGSTASGCSDLRLMRSHADPLVHRGRDRRHRRSPAGSRSGRSSRRTAISTPGPSPAASGSR